MRTYKEVCKELTETRWRITDSDKKMRAELDIQNGLRKKIDALIDELDTVRISEEFKEKKSN